MENNWERKVAQARLVYGRHTQIQRIEAGEPYMKVGSASLSGPPGTVPMISDDGQPILTARTQLMCFTFEIVNNSKEPIGNVLIRALDGVTRQPLDYVGVPFGPIAPESAEQATVCTPNIWGNGVQMLVEARFQDSAGHKWVRVEAEPETEYDGG